MNGKVWVGTVYCIMICSHLFPGNLQGLLKVTAAFWGGRL